MRKATKDETVTASLLTALRDALLKLEAIAEECDRALAQTREKLEEIERNIDMRNEQLSL